MTDVIKPVPSEIGEALLITPTSILSQVNVAIFETKLRGGGEMLITGYSKYQETSWFYKIKIVVFRDHFHANIDYAAKEQIKRRSPENKVEEENGKESLDFAVRDFVDSPKYENVKMEGVV